MTDEEIVPAVEQPITTELAKVHLETAQAASKLARAAFIATLPVATVEQAAAVILAAREVEVKRETAMVASGLNQNFRLTEEQQDQVNAAKAAHKVMINDAAVKAEAAEMVQKARLRSYKLTTRRDGRIALTVSGVL